MALMPTDEALDRILAGVTKTSVVTKGLREANGYTLASDVIAKRTQPPFPASAMDGYAVRFDDIAIGKTLTVTGEAAAGHAFDGVLRSNEAVRIFTGAPVPEGADTILIQEDAMQESGTTITATALPALRGEYVREAGKDFKKGDPGLEAGHRLDYRSLSLAASMNETTLRVYRKPRVGIISNGDELVPAGIEPGPSQIVASNSYGVIGLVEDAFGEFIDYGIVPDRADALGMAFEKAQEDRCDVLVTLGGASVGDHDLIKPTLEARGAFIDFWKIAMRPGKPLMFGSLGDMLILGMPGNPVSSLVCSIIFLRPLIGAMQGRDLRPLVENAILSGDLPKNGIRRAYMRGIITRNRDGICARVFEDQDSSLLSVLGRANALIIREPGEAAAKAGEPCRYIRI